MSVQSLHMMKCQEISGKMYQTSARFDVIVLITWILTDTRRSKTIQKNETLFEKLELSIGQIDKVLRKTNLY